MSGDRAQVVVLSGACLGKLAWSLLFVVGCACLLLAPGALAAKKPEVTGATMQDGDADGHADAASLRWSVPVRHKHDADGVYPLAVEGYQLTLLPAVKRKTTMVIPLEEQPQPDPDARPAISYEPTKSKPITNKKGKQAKRQRFDGTVPFGSPPVPGAEPMPGPDVDGDGYVADDCDPNDPSVHPGAADLPDAGFVDANCDGIDGDASNAVFVAPAGADDPGCGAQADPCATPQMGLDEAAASGKRDVYLQAASYLGETVHLPDGVSLYGGYGPAWERSGALAASTVLGGETTEPILGTTQAVTIIAADLVSPAIVADLTIQGPDTTERLDANGKGSYGIVVANVPAGVLTVERVHVIAGDGASGQPGSDGASASQTPAPQGTVGGDANEESFACNDTGDGGGGPGAVNGSVEDTRGGTGGTGGEMDTDCGFSPDFDATPGDAGGDATVFTASFGNGGPGGASCAAPLQPGEPGRVVHGQGGSAAPSSGQLISSFWYARSGGQGDLGEHGGGGGGGGGSGGCDTGIDSWGAGGGGGGAGGLRAPSAAAGGGGGGGSFGIYLIDASPTIRDSNLTRGSGGGGGQGGAGGAGQPGGGGGPGGNAAGESPAGAAGGAGGRGGSSGGGAGGNGGISFAIYSTSDLSQPVLNGNSISGGSGGSPGSGGAAPLAGGNSGQTGVGGTLGMIATCSTPSSC